MSEIVEESNWVERLPNPDRSQIIVIRHGESDYSGQGMDLTVEGVSQVQETAKKLEDYIKKFDCVFVVSSPTSRATGSARVFEGEINLKPDVSKISRAVGSVDIKDFKRFMEYNEEHSTPIYGEMWLKDAFLERENPITESRNSVNKRASRFLYHYGRAIEKISKSVGVKICVLVFTHFEIGINYLQGLYSGSNQFPIEEQVGLRNAEPAIIQLDNTSEDLYTIYARGASSRVRYDKDKGVFSKRD